jgi:uncharacterized repeat protein (TIGR02543 family)
MVIGIFNSKRRVIADKSVQANWQENDPTKKSYIRGKPDFEKLEQLLEDLSTSKFPELEEKIFEVMGQLTDLDEAVSDKFEEVAEALEALKTSATEDKEELEGLIKALQDAVSDLAEELDKVNGDLSTAISDLEDEIKDLIEELKESQETDKEAILDQIEALQDKINEIEEKIETLDTEIGSEIEGLKGLIGALTADKLAIEEAIEAISEKVESLEDDVAALETTLETAMEDIAEIQENLDQFQTDVAETLGQINEKLDAIKEVTDTFVKYTIEYDANSGDQSTCPEELITYQNVIILPATMPTKENYTFLGWALNPTDLPEKFHLPEDMIVINQNVKFYAMWMEGGSGGGPIVIGENNWIETLQAQLEASPFGESNPVEVGFEGPFNTVAWNEIMSVIVEVDKMVSLDLSATSEGTSPIPTVMEMLTHAGFGKVIDFKLPDWME